jgi:hypothetical protein
MPTNICAHWNSSLCDMNRKQKGTESINSLLTVIILALEGYVVMHVKNLQLIGILLLDNPQYPWKD